MLKTCLPEKIKKQPGKGSGQKKLKNKKVKKARNLNQE
jgi:hypothetical protein